MIVVTGASKGIGRAIILAALARAETVLAVSRGKSALKSLELDTQSLPGKLFCLSADLSTRLGCVAVSDYLAKLETNAPIRLINNVGRYSTADLLDELDEFEALLSINLLAAHRLSRLLLPRLDRIITIGSVGAIDFPEQMTAYAASKAALHGWYHAMVKACRNRPIKLNLVVPGATLTSSWDGETDIPDNILSPEQVAATVISLLESKDSAKIVEIRPSLDLK